MKYNFVTAVMALPALYSCPADAASGCEARNNQLMAQVRQVSDQAGSMGICQAARALERIYSQAAALLRQCPTLDPTGSDANAYEQGAREAQQAAEASCM